MLIKICYELGIMLVVEDRKMVLGNLEFKRERKIINNVKIR